MTTWIITFIVAVLITALLYYVREHSNEYGSTEDVERYIRNSRGDYRC